MDERMNQFNNIDGNAGEPVNEIKEQGLAQTQNSSEPTSMVESTSTEPAETLESVASTETTSAEGRSTQAPEITETPIEEAVPQGAYLEDASTIPSNQEELNNNTTSIATPEVITSSIESEPAFEKKPDRKKNNFGKKLAAACLVAIVGGTSIGAGLSIGSTLSSNYLTQAEVTEEPASLVFSESVQDAISQNISPTATLLATTENNIANVVNEALDSVVSINIKGQEQIMFFGNQVYQPEGAGSGYIYKDDGEKLYIITNYHVIEDAKEVTISVDDETQIPANYVGGDEEADVAVISVSKADMDEAGISYKTVTFGDSDNIRIGEYALAIGNALGEGKTVTMGIISAIKNEVAIQDKTMSLIQTDAAINSGNSGGPLINIDGEVIGMNTAKLSGTGIEGMGYSIPANTVREIADTIISDGKIDRPYLGIECISITEDMQKVYGLPIGVYVSNVVSGGPADTAGIIASDVIVGFDDKKITSYEDLTEALASHSSEDTVKIYIYRNGKTPMTYELTLKNRNDKF